MTKAQRIRELYKTGQYTTVQIADVVGCRPEYVRVVARQRPASGGMSETERRWRLANAERYAEWRREYAREYQRSRYRNDPEFRAKGNERWRKWYWLGGGRERRAEARAS